MKKSVSEFLDTYSDVITPIQKSLIESVKDQVLLNEINYTHEATYYHYKFFFKSKHDDKILIEIKSIIQKFDN